MAPRAFYTWFTTLGFIFCGLLLNSGSARAEMSLYFTDRFTFPDHSYGLIRVVRTDGTGLRTLVDVGGGLRGIAIDSSANRLYWADVRGDVIRWANIDGSAPEDIITEGLLSAVAIVLDPTANLLAWGDWSADQIGTAELNGAHAEPLFPTPFYADLAFDTVNGKIYWTTTLNSVRGQLLRSNLDGSDSETVVPGAKPHKIALDVPGGKIYWTDVHDGAVRRANLDGSDVEDLLVDSIHRSPLGIAVDLEAGKLYWGEPEHDTYHYKIMRMNLDGSNPEDFLVGDLGAIHSIVLAPVDLPTPTRATSWGEIKRQFAPEIR